MAERKATDEQIVEAIKAHGSQQKAADALGLTKRSVERRYAKIRDSGGPSVYPIMPAGQKLRGVSTLSKIVDPTTGEPVLQWVKTQTDPALAETETLAMLDALRSEMPRAEPVIASPRLSNARLAALFTITDFHLGAYSWAEETGADWDMQIAEDLLVSWFMKALAASPDAQLGILAQLGDFLHYDSLAAVTPTSGHQLDADSRAQKMIRVGLRVLRRVILMMLDKYPQVVVIMAEGNHDIISSAWLRETFRMIFENEPRVQIIVRPDPYYAIEWGDIGLFWHHGHLKKPEQLDRIFARKFREIFGRAKRCYGHCGHLHHKVLIETALMPVEQHATLAAADAYASRNGFMSDRQATVILYDKQFGEVGRISISPEMAKAQGLETLL